MKRLLVGLVSLFAAAIAALLIYQSWTQPPPQTRLDLIETNLSLQSQAAREDPNYGPLAEALVGGDVLTSATNSYQTAIDGLKGTIAQKQIALDNASPLSDSNPALQGTRTELDTLRAELDGLALRLGVLQANRAQLELAETNWQQIETPDMQQAADILEVIWGRQGAALAPESDRILIDQLDGWFEIVSLRKLYDLQGQSDALVDLFRRERDEAIAAVQRIALLATATGLGLIAGTVTLVGWGISRWFKRAELKAIAGWKVPWDWFQGPGILATWFLAFIVVSQVVSLFYSAAIGVPVTEMSNVQQAISTALNYGSSAAIGLLLIWATARNDGAQKKVTSSEHDELFRFKLFDRWPLWGVGGYLVAFPLVTLAAVVGRSLLPSSGGGNPILPILLESEGWLVQAIYLCVVSVMAPIFEETLFRGFLLPSLTVVMPVWGAIALSSLLFATAHLNLSDMLPLTVLGMLLGYIYTRTRNLLAPMLLHGLWNAGSFAALLVLGNAV